MVATKALGIGWHPRDEVPGLALWVKSNGARRWVLDYRFHGRQRRLTLGHGDVMRPAEAVKLARKHRVAIDSGHDPLAERDAARKAEAANVTLEEFWTRYLEEHATLKKQPRTLRDNLEWWARDLKPVLGRTRLGDITPEDAAALHRRITRRGAPVMANRVIALLAAMLSRAEKWGLRPPQSNPCRGIDRNPERKAHRFLSSEQLLALGAALTAAERAPADSAEHESAQVVTAIRLLLFTGCRRGEVLNLQWEHVNLERGLLDLPTSKTGRKVVVLNAPAMQLLASLPRTSAYVLPSRDPSKPMVNISKAWGHIRTRAGLDGVRLHDLRHSFASTAAGLGASLPIIGSLLGHTVPATTARYAGIAADPRREAAEAVGKRLASLLSPVEKPAAVVPMRKRRSRRG
jgi:integrase